MGLNVNSFEVVSAAEMVEGFHPQDSTRLSADMSPKIALRVYSGGHSPPNIDPQSNIF
jgi:hypothetical protein